MPATHEDIQRATIVTWRLVKTEQRTNAEKRERYGRCRPASAGGGCKVIIGGPWRYARGVSLRFLINFYTAPEYISAGKGNRPHIRTFMRHGFAASIRFLSRSLFIFSSLLLVLGVVTPSTRTGGTLSFRPISLDDLYGNLINSFLAELAIYHLPAWGF